MSHQNSIPTLQRELASEYGRHVQSNSNKGFMRTFFKVLVMPFVAMLIILTGASFTVANFSPAMYTQAKDIIFANVDFEKITGQTDLINKQFLDSWLILNSDKQQGEGIAQGEMAQEELIETPLN